MSKCAKCVWAILDFVNVLVKPIALQRINIVGRVEAHMGYFIHACYAPTGHTSSALIQQKEDWFALVMWQSLIVQKD
eukprot:528560-Amphidinium_carterae.1